MMCETRADEDTDRVKKGKRGGTRKRDLMALGPPGGSEGRSPDS